MIYSQIPNSRSLFTHYLKIILRDIIRSGHYELYNH